MSRQINLYDPALRSRRDYAAATVLLLGGAVVALGLLVAWGYFTVELRQLSGQALTVESLFQEKQEQVRLLQEELGTRQKDKKVEARLLVRQAELAGRQEVLAALDSGQLDASPVFSEIFEALGRQRVDGVWLTKVDLDAGGQSMTLEGRTLDPDLLAAYLRRLNSEKALRGTRFAVLDLAREPEAAAVLANEAGGAKKPDRPQVLSFRLSAKRAPDADSAARRGGP